MIESSSAIKFVCHQYYYPEMVNQMKNAKVSYWNNKWNEIYDFTPNKIVTKGLNYSLSLEPTSDFVTSLDDMKKIVAQVEKKKGEKIGHLKGKKFILNLTIIKKLGLKIFTILI